MAIESEYWSQDDDWEVLKSFLPLGWEQKAKETGAMVRFRKIANAEELLRYLLIHLADGCSLRETVVRIREGFGKDLSDVALLKRLNASGIWFQWMSNRLMGKWLIRSPLKLLGENYQVRLIDGSTIQEPGATGTTWKIHYSIYFPSLLCDELHVTSPKTGETFKNFTVNSGDVFIGDRGYANRPGVHHVVTGGGHVIVRLNLENLPLEDEKDDSVHIISLLKTLRKNQIGDWDVWYRHEGNRVKGRLCAIKKSKESAQKAKDLIIKQAKKNRTKVKPDTLKAAEYIFVYSTLDRNEISKTSVLELYRGRWQVELAFKRLKSILSLGHLRKQDVEGSKAWINGKFFVAILIETMIEAGRSFFPWGYPISDDEPESMPLEGN